MQYNTENFDFSNTPASPYNTTFETWYYDVISDYDVDGIGVYKSRIHEPRENIATQIPLTEHNFPDPSSVAALIAGLSYGDPARSFWQGVKDQLSDLRLCSSEAKSLPP